MNSILYLHYKVPTIKYLYFPESQLVIRFIMICHSNFVTIIIVKQISSFEETIWVYWVGIVILRRITRIMYVVELIVVVLRTHDYLIELFKMFIKLLKNVKLLNIIRKIANFVNTIKSNPVYH